MATVHHLHRATVYEQWPDTMPVEPADYDAPTAAEAYRAEWLQAAEAATSVGAEPRGKHRTGLLAAMFLRLRHWALG